MKVNIHQIMKVNIHQIINVNIHQIINVNTHQIIKLNIHQYFCPKYFHNFNQTADHTFATCPQQVLISFGRKLALGPPSAWW